MLRAGFLGCGRISDLHATEYLRNEQGAIAAVCDANAELARAKAAAWGVPPSRVFTRQEDLIACAEVDLVEVLLPHDLHAPATLSALAAGKAVSVQKPMATWLKDAQAMVAAGTRGFFKVFENFVFYPPVEKAKALVEEERSASP